MVGGLEGVVVFRGLEDLGGEPPLSFVGESTRGIGRERRDWKRLLEVTEEEESSAKAVMVACGDGRQRRQWWEGGWGLVGSSRVVLGVE
ncbi:unnamed protein product [Linum trigynum]|uniref:Uncharacterized protein n=1 Tax=Linum trigynum TaxID=586398 RepID=A0AAV2C8L7_9ROSI